MVFHYSSPLIFLKIPLFLHSSTLFFTHLSSFFYSFTLSLLFLGILQEFLEFYIKVFLFIILPLFVSFIRSFFFFSFAWCPFLSINVNAVFCSFAFPFSPNIYWLFLSFIYFLGYFLQFFLPSHFLSFQTSMFCSISFPYFRRSINIQVLPSSTVCIYMSPHPRTTVQKWVLPSLLPSQNYGLWFLKSVSIFYTSSFSTIFLSSLLCMSYFLFLFPPLND